MHVFFKYLLKPTSRASPNEAVNARSTAKNTRNFKHKILMHTDNNAVVHGFPVRPCIVEQGDVLPRYCKTT